MNRYLGGGVGLQRGSPGTTLGGGGPGGAERLVGGAANQGFGSSVKNPTHREGILAAVEHGPSNSKLEGPNSKIRLSNLRGHGHHLTAAVIAMIYLCCDGITVELPKGRCGDLESEDVFIVTFPPHRFLPARTLWRHSSSSAPNPCGVQAVRAHHLGSPGMRGDPEGRYVDGSRLRQLVVIHP